MFYRGTRFRRRMSGFFLALAASEGADDGIDRLLGAYSLSATDR